MPRHHIKRVAPKKRTKIPKFPAVLIRKQVGDRWLRNYLNRKTVAVVGNGFCPRDVSKQVDKHHIIIRLNTHTGRLRKGFSTTKPRVPTGVKTTAVGFGWTVAWGKGKISNITKEFPSVKLLFYVRPLSEKGKIMLKLAQMNKSKVPMFAMTNAHAGKINGLCQGPALTGMSMAYILLAHNSAAKVDFYNFNFYTLSLNRDPEAVKIYKKMVKGGKGNRRCGQGKGHNLTASYKWFYRMIRQTKNFHWDVTSSEHKEIRKFLL